jgi:hypothetical protein
MEETAKGAAAKQADGAEAEAGLKEQENEDWRQGLRGMSAKTVASFSPQGVRKVSTFSERSLFLLSKDNPLRVAVMRVIVSKKFDNFIFMLIILNCVTLAMGSNEPNFDETSLGKFLALTEWFFTPLFCLEMVLKVVGMGFFLKPGAYLRDGWNVLDFLVVVLGLVASSGLIGNYTSIRTVRVLRPLRTLTAVEGLRKLVVTLMSALPMLGNVLLLCGFFVFHPWHRGHPDVRGAHAQPLRLRGHRLCHGPAELHGAGRRGRPVLGPYVPHAAGQPGAG